MPPHTNPLVSIITPSFNQGRFIRGTIEAVASQTYKNIEHIIIDGGSTDSTVDVLKECESLYGIRWISEDDSGMYDAVNKGLRMANGEIVAYLNSDDRYFPWSVEKAVSVLASDPSASMAYGDLWNLDVETGQAALLIHPQFTLRRLASTGFIAQPTAFWKRSAMDKIGLFDDGLAFVGDTDYWLRLMKVGRARKINDVMAIELNHEATKRSTQYAALDEELAKVRKSHMPTRIGGAWSLWFRSLGFLQRRVQYASLTLSYLRKSEGRPWGKFLTLSDPKLRWGKAMLAVTPFGGQSHVRGMIQPRNPELMDPRIDKPE